MPEQPIDEWRLHVEGDLAAIFMNSRDVAEAEAAQLHLMGHRLVEVRDRTGSIVWTPTWRAD